MRRGVIIAGAGATVAVAGAAWYALVNRGVVTDVHIAGVAVKGVALGAVVAGAVLAIGGLVSVLRARRVEAREATVEAVDQLDAPEYVWPTIVVRRHGRPRRASAQIVSLPPPTWSMPLPQHPSMTAGIPARHEPPLPQPACDR
jgi:hypothetical protein